MNSDISISLRQIGPIVISINALCSLISNVELIIAKRRFWSQASFWLCILLSSLPRAVPTLLSLPLDLEHQKTAPALVLFFIIRKFNLHLGICKISAQRFISYLLEDAFMYKTSFPIHL